MKKLISIIILVLLWCLPISAYEIGNIVYLNACGANPQKYFDKPLNIQNIVTEVPNRITKLEKSKYDREFQTLATSAINLGNDKIEISVSNFRDLTIKNSSGDVLDERKISGASSVYELRHKDKIVAWGVGWHKRCGESYETDFTALRIFLPIKKDNKISIEQKLISLNINPFYKATINSEKLIITDAVEIGGSSRASTYYYGGQKFYQLDHLDGIKSIDTYEELHKKIDVLQISPARMINILGGYYETEVLNKYTKANFDNIYKDLLTKFWDISYEFDNGDNLWESISDLNVSDEYIKALRAVENRELLMEDFPPIDGAIPNLKKNCFKNDTYENLIELVRNCYFFHSSYAMNYGFSDPKWFAVQTEFKDSKDLLNEDKEKRFENYLDHSITDMKSIVWGEDSMDGTVVDDLISIFQRANGGYKVSKDKDYVVISGCEYKSCGTKGLVFIDTESTSVIGLIRHFDYDIDTSTSKQPGEWLIFSYWHDKYKDLPKEFLNAVEEWRAGQDIPLPQIIRYVGGFGDDIELVKKDQFNGKAFTKEIKLDEIINYFNFCKTLSSFGPSCSDDYNPRDYLNSLKITIKENEIHYMDEDIWEYYFTIIEKTNDETIVSFEDLAIEGNYKARDLFKFKFDEENSIWKLNSIKNVFPNNETEYTPYKD